MSYFSRSWRAIAACCAALVILLLAGRVDAVSIRLPLSEIDAASAVVVAGRVERIESAWNAQGQIESTVYLQLGEVSRGSLSVGSLIPIRVLGGTMDGLTMVSSEEPVFETGEEAYLFLAASQGGVYRLTAGEQGRFRIVGDRAVNRFWPAGLRLTELKVGVREGRWPVEPEPTGGVWPDTVTSASGVALDAYKLNNAKWFGPNAMEEPYVINVNTSDAGTAYGSVEAFRSAIIAAGNTWSNAGAAFSFKYGGATGSTSWTNDNQNVVYWQNLGNVSTLAEAQWWKYNNGQIIDVDLRFNDYYIWDATGAPANRPDLRSVATHELGHWLSLGHDDDPGCPGSTPVMCPSYIMGQLKWTLGANDIAGIKAVYGLEPTVRVYLSTIRR